jgi:tetratricopeptide (TPR) repeat protein
MALPDWRTLSVNDGILMEPVPEGGRLVLWLPEERSGGFQYWQRLGTVANTEVTVEQGVYASEATSIRARQRVGGLFGGLFRGFGRKAGDTAWMLPNGTSAQQCGDRRNDLLLVWTQDDGIALDEAQIRLRWQACQGVQKIGTKLFVVSGIAPAAQENAAATALPQGGPRAQAETMLAAARQSGNRRAEASALTDLGVSLTHDGDAQRALPAFEDALGIARTLGDASMERDVVGNLALASLAAGAPERAQELFAQVLANARAASDRFSEKLALEGLALVHTNRGEHAQALAHFDEALAVARSVGDRHQEANLLWYSGMVHAQQGEREQAIATAQAAVEVMAASKKPEADVFADHLQKYRLAGQGALLNPGAGAAGMPLSPAFGGGMVTTVMAGQTSTPAPAPAAGPNLLYMAISAARSMTKFLKSRMQTVTAETRQKRLRTCASCEHHTGTRCRICGCFTNLKTWLPHEDCPIGKWPG